jgi:hypothetical protein
VYTNEFEREEIDLNLKKSIRYCTRMEIWDYQILKWILLIIVPFEFETIPNKSKKYS